MLLTGAAAMRRDCSSSYSCARVIRLVAASISGWNSAMDAGSLRWPRSVHSGPFSASAPGTSWSHSQPTSESQAAAVPSLPATTTIQPSAQRNVPVPASRSPSPVRRRTTPVRSNSAAASSSALAMTAWADTSRSAPGWPASAASRPSRAAMAPLMPPARYAWEP